jgi:hypothetical protein
MKRIFSLLAIGALGAWATAAQTTASGQAGASMQTQTGVQASNSGAQSSGSGSAKASSSASANAKAGKNSNSASLSNGTKIDATLTSWLDAKRSRVGDPVEAHTESDVKQGGKVVLKKGTRLIGHVTQAQVRATGQAQSEIGVMFDQAVLKNGQEMPFHASIRALASAPSAMAGSTGADDVMASGGGMGSAQGSARGGGLAGGLSSTAGATTGTVMNTASPVSSTAGGTVNTAVRSSGAVGGLTSSGRLTSNSSGVFGLEGLSIDSAASSSARGSMIVSATKNVHLGAGTQLLLQTTEQAH